MSVTRLGFLNGSTVIGFEFRLMTSGNICTLDMRKCRDSRGLIGVTERMREYE